MHTISINPKSLFDSTLFGFSQIVVSNVGKHIFISGQVAWDEQRNIIGKNDLQLQAQKAVDNLSLALNVAGGTLNDVVMLRIYIVNYQAEHAPIISEILKKNFNQNNLPASTWVSVQGLANEHFMIEIEAQAMI